MLPQAEHEWRAHASEVLDLAWVGEGSEGMLVSSSADHTVRLWTTQGHYVGRFGQQQSWDMAEPATYQHPSQPLPEEPTSTASGKGEWGGILTEQWGSIYA